MLARGVICFMLAAVVCFGTVAAQTGDVPKSAIEVEPVLCTGIEERMPVGEADVFPADVGRVYLWMQVTGVEGGEVVLRHAWLREGVEMAEVELPVKGSPWRTYSYKTIPPEWAGKWEVKIVGPDGNVMESISFTVGADVPEEKPVEEKKDEPVSEPPKKG